MSKESGWWSALGAFPKLQMLEDLADDFRLFDDRLLETLPVAVWNRKPRKQKETEFEKNVISENRVDSKLFK